MLFLYPLFLWALLALLIPIIIHLFNLKRYKIVYFTNVKFLKELKQKSKAKSRLKEILILICRCLALTCLVLAFSEPYIPTNANKDSIVAAKVYSIYLDNSFSTQNINKLGKALEIAKLKAKELLKSFNNTDKIQIITNDFEGRHQRLHTKQDALGLIDEIKPTATVRYLSQVINRQTEFLRQTSSSSKNIIIFSDLQKSTFDLQSVKPDTSVQVLVLPVIPNLVNNVFIDSCWFEYPYQQLGFTQKLHARVVNMGANNLEVLSAKLIINQQQVALSSFSIEAKAKAEIKFTFNCKQPGFNYCEIKLDDYPITFDDNLFFTFNSTNHIEVCILNGRGKSNQFSSLFKNDSLFVLHESNELAIDYSVFKTSDVIILNQLLELSSGLISELNLFTKKGGSVLIIPNMENNLENTNKLFNNFKLPQILGLDTSLVKMNEIDQQKGFYEGVFEKKEDRMNLPKVKKHYKLNSNSKFENILSLQNGDALLGFSNLNQAKIYLMTTSLEPDVSNFFNHALLVPTLYKICFNSIKQTQLFFTVQGHEQLQIKSNPNYLSSPITIYNLSEKNDFIPETRLSENNLIFYFQHQPQSPGFYLLKHEKIEILPLAFNYSRLESNLNNFTFEEVNSIIEKKNLNNVKLINYQDTKSGELTSLVEGGKKLWKLFLLLALAFIMIEIALLRFLK